MLQMVSGVVRHTMTFGGGFLVDSGLTTSKEWDAAVAAVITLLGIGWSIYEKRKSK